MIQTPVRSRFLSSPAARSALSVAVLLLTVLPVGAERTTTAEPPPTGQTVLADPRPDLPDNLGPVRIEVAFVLDTTGSMSGLIDGAKQKIWSIANRLVSNQQRSGVRMALIGYRDRGDQYVTRRYDLTTDIDKIYGHLREFRADGGGDGPESVNQALHEAVHDLSWSEDEDVYRVVFLVGDAPPHMDYGDVPFDETALRAGKRDISVNTIQCGNWDETARVWKQIASLASGQYAAIAQDGGMLALSTPMDGELAQLNRELAGTVIAYGKTEEQREIKRKVDGALGAEADAAADRLSYLAKSGGRVVSGAKDLVDAARDGLSVGDVAESELPPEMKVMAPAEREAYVARNRAERERLQSQVQVMSKRRDAYIAEELAKREAEGKGDGFDAEVFRTIEGQAGKKGITYD